MMYRTSQSNELLTREERQKQIQDMFPENKIEFKQDNLLRNATVQTKTGGIFPAAEIVLVMLVIFGILATLHYLGFIKPA